MIFYCNNVKMYTSNPSNFIQISFCQWMVGWREGGREGGMEEGGREGGGGGREGGREGGRVGLIDRWQNGGFERLTYMN